MNACNMQSIVSVAHMHRKIFLSIYLLTLFKCHLSIVLSLQNGMDKRLILIPFEQLKYYISYPLEFHTDLLHHRTRVAGYHAALFARSYV